MSQTPVTSDLKNPQKVSKKFIEALALVFENLAKDDEKLVKRILNYVVDGEDSDVLLALFKNADVAKCIGYNPSLNWEERQAHANKRLKLFSLRKDANPQVWLRLGEVLEAVMQANNYFTQPPGWPAGLTALMGELSVACVQQLRSNQETWTAMDIDEIFCATNVGGEAFLGIFTTPNFGQSMPWGYASLSGGYGHRTELQDINKLAEKYEAKLLKELESPSAEKLTTVIDFLEHAKFHPASMHMQLTRLACSSQKTVRQASLKLLVDANGKGRPEYFSTLQKILESGNTAERTEAVSMLWKLYGIESQDVLRKHLDTEKNEKIKTSINKFLNASSSHDDDECKYELPAINVETGVTPLPESFATYLKETLRRGHVELMRYYEDQVKAYENPETRKYMREPQKPKALDDANLDKIIAFVEGREKSYTPDFHLNQVVRSAGKIIPEDLNLIQIVRLSKIFLMLQLNEHNHSSISWYDRSLVENYYQKHPEISLREIDYAVSTLPNGSPGLIAYAYLRNNNKWSNFFDWDNEKVWPLFAEYPDILRSVLAPSTKYNQYEIETLRANAFKVLAMFPKVPSEYVPMLWELALGETKAERYRAQNALAGQPNKTATIVAALTDGKQSIRSAAAEWLGELGDKEAIEPLKAAFKKEKNEVAKGIIMVALDKLGANVDEFLNRDELLKEATTGLKKMPKGMEWFPLDALPALHWQDTGKLVEPDIVKWWVVQSVQQKTPTCGPILRKYLSMCKKTDACALANYILSTWIAYDTAHPSHEEAHKKADADATHAWNTYGQQWQQHYGSKEALYKLHYNSIIQTLLNSAIDQKGMLAVVAAAGDADSVKMIDKYIRKYAGNKLAHSKAFVEVLSWIDLQLSLQVLLSFANRFKTKAVKLAAEEHVQAKADRQGWTIEELADRTIPDGGFERPKDENGIPIGRDAVLELDFGARQFEVKLNDELEPVVMLKGENKVLKALPNPGKDDDEEKAKEAKKSFSDAKKVIKEVVKRQAERLYEALCTQRSWRFEDWQHFLADHPVVGRQCIKLVWSAYESKPGAGDEKIFLGCFRPLEDGSLTNENDEEVKLPADAQIFVAHSCNTPAQVGEAWMNHFKDYDVTPLFKQFGRDPYTLPDSKGKESEIKDFQGHMISSFKLRSRATKLGYVRGAAEDGGCFYTYSKQFGSLELEATISFTGSYLPEQDIPTALTSLNFSRIQKESTSYSWNQNFLPLSKIPAVLLSECYNDMKQIAADGSGFDAEWEKKSAL